MSDAFVQAFAGYWQAPSLDGLGALLHEDVVLTQPLAPPICGLEAAREAFRRNFELIPDLHAVVDHAHTTADRVVFEFRLRGHVGARFLEWPAVDVFCLRGTRAAARAAYFDPLPLVGALLTTPAVWRRWWRSARARPRALGEPAAARLSGR